MAMKMMEKIVKKGKPIKSDVEKEALEGLFGDLRDSARGAMKGGLDKVGKVKAVVSADNKEDLKKGLEKAKEVVEQTPEMESAEDEVESSDEIESEDSSCEEVVELAQDKSPEEIEEMIQKLQDLKKSKI